MFNVFNRAGQKAIMDILIGLIVPITTLPFGAAFIISTVIAVIAYAFGLDGLDYGTSIMSETAGPMTEITARLLLPIYLALVLFFCHCWDHGTTNIFDLTRNFIRDLLRSAHFRVLHLRRKRIAVFQRRRCICSVCYVPVDRTGNVHSSSQAMIHL